MSFDVIEIAQKLISFPSVTPKDEGAQQFLAQMLENMGFECHHLVFGEGGDAVPNLFARRGAASPHLCFAGHTDVVPAEPAGHWKYPPFDAHIEDGIMYGRGTSDMKGGVAAFVAATGKYLEENPLQGSISFLITGDEEGPAINGTVKVLEWMKDNNHIPDICLVGEPTNPDHLGQFIKTGRRGSMNITFSTKGKSGHVAHPHIAENPIPKLAKMLNALNEHVFDEGNALFEPTNLELTTIEAGKYVDNLVPDEARAKLNIRFNDIWTKETLIEEVRKILNQTGFNYDIEDVRCDANSTVTPPNGWTALVRQAIKDVTAQVAAYTTGGATSDARFIGQYCPTLEFGVTTQTMHKVDENVAVQDLKNLTEIYTRIIDLADKMSVEELNKPE